ncbi:MAG: RNA polymerase sigma factor [Myxococcaceae bacterium]|nr:RNA polymerase sigma factor [Myxococcaceae bacterium]
MTSPAFSPAATAAASSLTELKSLYDEMAQPLRRALARLAGPGCDADDLLQEVFVVALKRPEQVLAAVSPKAWLYGVAVRVAAGARTRRRFRSFLGLESAGEVAADDAAGPFAAVTRIEARAKVHKALDALSGKRREALVLFELEGLTGPEISEALDIPIKTVWTRLHHARKDFEHRLKQEGRE